jgi:hypothetical protein
MRKVREYQNNFSKGEICPSLHGHGDLAGYYEGVSLAENVWVTSSGSVAKRYGLFPIKEYGTVGYVKLFEMAIVSGQRFLVVVRDGNIDILDPAYGELVATVSVSDFSGDRLADIYGAAYQDSMIFTHHGFPPKHLKWGPGNIFTIGDIEFRNIPTFEFIPNDVTPTGTCTPSGTSGFISLTSSVDIFVTGDVGKYVTLLPTGRFRIDAVNNGRTVRGYLEEALFDGSTVPSGDWTIERGWEPLWGGTSGYPAVCGFHDGRLIVCNFPRVSTVFSYSVIHSPFDFSLGDGTTAYGGWRILSYDQRDGICHMSSHHSLYFFCENGEYVVDQSTGDSLGKAVILHDTSMGTVRRCRPVSGEDGSQYFFQRNSTSLSKFSYSFDNNSYRSEPISKYASHLIYLPRSCAMWKGDDIFGTNLLFYVNGDGTMVSAALNTNEKILAFSRVTSPLGKFSELCLCGDQVFTTVVRDDGSLCVMKFLSGNFLDDGTPYESQVVLLPMSDETSSPSDKSTAVTQVHVYMSDTSYLKVGNDIIYAGLPATKKIKCFLSSGWYGDGNLKLSDGGHGTFWQVNNVGRTALVG